MIGAYYYPWFGPPPTRIHWRDGYKGTPILGEYDSGDPVVISKHIDWATGHGIDFFLISWWGPSDDELRPWDRYIDANIRDCFLGNSLVQDIKFGILYESSGRLIEKPPGKFDLDNPVNIQRLIDDFDYLAKHYFEHPQYLRINGAPVVFIDVLRLYVGNVGRTFGMVRENLKKKGHRLYLMSDQVCATSPDDPNQREIMKAVDAIGTYQPFQMAPYFFDQNAPVWRDFEGYTERVFEVWKRAAERSGKPFIPSAVPGFDQTANPKKRNVPILQRSTERFRKQCEIAKKYLDEDIRIIMITTFNEWGEYTCVEPSEEDGFAYLEIVKETLAGH